MERIWDISSSYLRTQEHLGGASLKLKLPLLWLRIIGQVRWKKGDATGKEEGRHKGIGASPSRVKRVSIYPNMEVIPLIINITYGTSGRPQMQY